MKNINEIKYRELDKYRNNYGELKYNISNIMKI